VTHRIRTLNVAVLIALVVGVPGCGPTTSSDESSVGGDQQDSESSEGPLDIGLGTDETLDVVTWNIEEFPKNGQTTVDAVVEILQGLDADIVALQEISDVDSFEQMVDQIPGWEGYVESEWYAGLAYLYRTDVIETGRNYEIYTTEEYWAAFPRSPQVMEFRFRAQDFVVINNHFKCCGDGRLDPDYSWDEETRRMDAIHLLKEYIDTHFAQSRVIVLGDLNDSLTDMAPNNVFASLLNDPDNYRFADMAIAEGDASEWSFPSYPSHLDHILITNELFDGFEHKDSRVSPLPVDEVFFDEWWDYEHNVSDHRPVALTLQVPAEE
jgi:endonuclease/exonuclease/phosphatase family metal-dependent hydrolase